MKVLVVGGAGYVGGAVTNLLGKTNHQVRVYDGLLYEESYRKPVDFVFGDVRDQKRLRPHVDWADAVIWLAALVGDGACALNPDITTQINQDSVQWLSENFDGRIIYTSTCSVYGAQEGELDESSLLNPLSVYAVTKLNSERYLEGKNSIIYRLGTLFGVGDEFSRVRMDLVVNVLTVRAFFHGEVKVFGGEQYRPLLHVYDAAQTIVDQLTSTNTGVFNLKQQNVRIIDLANQLLEHFPKLKVETTPMHFQDSRNYRASSKKAEKILGFNPVRSIHDGITEVSQLLKEGRLKDVNNPRYTNQTFLSMFNTHHLAEKGGV